MSVVKYGLPVPPVTITIRFLSECRNALRLIYGSEICETVVAERPLVDL